MTKKLISLVFNILKIIFDNVIGLLLSIRPESPVPEVRWESETMEVNLTDDHVNTEVVPIYIDKNLLPKSDIIYTGVRYSINDEVFIERVETSKEIVKFDLYVSKKLDMEEEIERKSIAECLEGSAKYPLLNGKELSINLQKVPNGVIINTDVYLTDQQWNTITLFEDNTIFCAVCNSYFPKDDLGHTQEIQHKKFLNLHPPLEIYKLCIIRKINNKYHCGVCNEIRNDIDKHILEKNHEYKFSSAINKVSDIMYYYNLDTDDGSEMFQRITTKHTSEDEYSIDNFFNHTESDTYSFECPPDFSGTSYATMAKKPKTVDTRKSIEIEHGDKLIKINFFSYNMITSFQNNRFLCMACKFENHEKNKVEHCTDSKHLTEIKKCSVVGAYKDYYIRKIDEQFYHCSHCNTRQYKSQLENHIQTKHVRSIRNIVETEKDGTRPKYKQQKSDISDEGKFFDTNNNKFKTSSPLNNRSYIPEPPIFGDLIIFPFNTKYSVPFLSYNMTHKKGTCFYCELCNLDIDLNVLKRHALFDRTHAEKLWNTTFIESFSIHLLRSINNSIHCTICNVLLFNGSSAKDHTESQKHKELLEKAIQDAMKLPNPPLNIAITQNDYSRSINSTNDPIDNKIIKRTGNESSFNILIDEKTDSTEELTFDPEECIYVQISKLYVKILNTAYNTLVPIGDGRRYCFVCMEELNFKQLYGHIESRFHKENLEKHKYLDKYKNHLFRQVYLTYHCSICNVILKRKQIEMHLNWPTHEIQNKYACGVSKETRKNEIKSGMKLFTNEMQSENIFVLDNEPEIKILFNVRIVSEDVIDKKGSADNGRKNKLINFNDNFLKVSWEHWNGLTKSQKGFTCKICNREIGNEHIDFHMQETLHKSGVRLIYDKCNLIRKVNNIFICIICNCNLPSEQMLESHINGKKHKKIYEKLRESTAENDHVDSDVSLVLLK